ncbi:hypothetical protein OGATHE_005569 [Ogataea polymorpha]|uniref:Uncharacterized protein n=1 Tax=Ogataea polymorpha TaxID=460523 RepID=A0A9P8SYY2_9ASCO|nr:hypothetical protein OGATHE_005569 [Ogataea polymorpha]
MSASTSGYSTTISSTSIVSIWKPAFCIRVPTSEDSTNGDTRGERPPQRSISANCSAVRSSNSVSPANMDPTKHPFGCSELYSFLKTVGRSLIQCSDKFDTITLNMSFFISSGCEYASSSVLMRSMFSMELNGALLYLSSIFCDESTM